ncbi:ATP-binding cassette domain-containing protein [Corynebacterium glutamicum]|uniref:ATP-binding cassette domain-containing protein n=1 Tax=Corynebacterium glutamicum TaxID=1718 RepID=UPI000744B310|nr:ATP-binding cassette domain-containing protein [Corynebacterium glutamicum]AMA00332.1 hypothetical protein APT58_08875 [Corynebacterium glutamicum]
MNTPLLRSSGLSIRDTPFADVEIAPDSGLTLLSTGRESQSSSFSLVLSGRMRASTGTIELNGEPIKATKLAKHVALAGIPEIDSLERLVTVRTVVREQLAWSSPWYLMVPRDISDSGRWVDVEKHLGLNLDPKTLIGDLSVLERFKLRIALALLARPEAQLLVVDDPDQVRSMELRAEVLHALKGVAEDLPVVVVSTNPDFDSLADTALTITGAGN